MNVRADVGRRMGNRGISPIIATVLLMGFMVALGAFVFQWAKDFSKESVDIVVDEVTGNVLCQETSIAVNYTACPITTLVLANTGYHTVYRVIVRGATEIEKDIALAPQQTQTLNIASTNALVIIPVVREGNRMFGCADRRVMIAC